MRKEGEEVILKIDGYEVTKLGRPMDDQKLYIVYKEGQSKSKFESVHYERVLKYIEDVSKARVINGNKVYKNGGFWRVESADDSWDGYELYSTEQEAIEAAEITEHYDEYFDEDWYTPSATHGDYSPSCPWNAPGMSISDFI